MYTTQVVENQHIAMMPTNDDTRTIMYDNKFLIGDEKRYPPIAWKISKIQSSLNGSITRFTMTQEQFNPVTDNAELMIADYYQSAVTPETIEMEEGQIVAAYADSSSELKIVYAGQPAVRAGGGYKKFTLKTDIDGKLTDVVGDIEWSVDFSNGDSSKLETSTDGNIFKVKCLNDYSLIGKTFTVTAKCEYISKSVVVEVISL